MEFKKNIFLIVATAGSVVHKLICKSNKFIQFILEPQNMASDISTARIWQANE